MAAKNAKLGEKTFTTKATKITKARRIGCAVRTGEFARPADWAYVPGGVSALCAAKDSVTNKIIVAKIIVALLTALLWCANGDAQTPYFQGKTIRGDEKLLVE